MDKSWICLMVSRTLLPANEKAISRELSLIFRQDLLGYKVVCNEDITASGEYYLFVHCGNYWDHVGELGRCHFVTGVVPSKETPHHFSLKEISEFSSSVGRKMEERKELQNGDVVLVKDGYLKGLYGIVTDQIQPRKHDGKLPLKCRKSCKKCKVFFSFYVRQFSEALRVTSLEVIGKVSGYEFPSEVVGKPVVIGSHVVHHRKSYRAVCRKRQAEK